MYNAHCMSNLYDYSDSDCLRGKSELITETALRPVSIIQIQSTVHSTNKNQCFFFSLRYIRAFTELLIAKSRLLLTANQPFLPLTDDDWMTLKAIQWA